MKLRVSKTGGGANKNNHCSNIIGWETGYVRMAVAVLHWQCQFKPYATLSASGIGFTPYIDIALFPLIHEVITGIQLNRADNTHSFKRCTASLSMQNLLPNFVQISAF